MRHVWRAGAAAVAVLTGAGSAVALAGAPAAQASARPAATIPLHLIWTAHVSSGQTYVELSSPNVATVGGAPTVVVGDAHGNVYAVKLATGTPVYTTNVGAPVTSTPSVLPGGTVIVGSGNSADACAGGYTWVFPNGTHATVPATNPSTGPCGGGGSAVRAGVAIGTLESKTAAVAGSLGQNLFALTASTRQTLAGYPWFQADSDFGTPALADVEGTGTNQVVLGGASSHGLAYGRQYTNGGHIQILTSTANAGTGTPAGGLVCHYTTTQSVTTSPAVGKIFGGTAVGIVATTGAAWPNPTDNHKVIAITPSCAKAWTTVLAGTMATQSPALADVTGNGHLQVVATTTTGSVYALTGTNGAILWHTALPHGVLGSPVTADLTSSGHQDVLVASENGLYILTGTNGQIDGNVETTTGFQNAPLVTHDANGTIGITVAGYQNTRGTYIYHFEVTGSNGALVNEAGAWPQFHHDAQLTGNAGTPPPGPLEVPCSAPPAGSHGYYLTGGDGGIFTFGSAPFCGSTGNIRLNQPIVGMTPTPARGGYWLVAADGGIFTFGNAPFYGSMGGTHLNKPIVGMAVDPKTGGYWLVASDGGIFSFNAPFYGSTGSMHLNQPIVGMAATPTGGGYWLVASDGGIFSFGNAAFYGSTGSMHLNKPIVGMAVDPATGGYWLVASDGGIFSFHATWFGSTGGMHLNQPIVGMAPTTTGGGYWLGAADGGIFTFGNAPYAGSMGGTHLNKPIVAMTGF